MSYLKYTPYLYLIFGFYFIYHGFTQLNIPGETPWLSFVIAALAIFMFFFRLRFAKKLEDRNKKT